MKSYLCTACCAHGVSGTRFAPELISEETTELFCRMGVF